MTETTRQQGLNKARANAEAAKAQKDWDMYEFWMKKATFLWAIGKQSN